MEVFTLFRAIPRLASSAAEHLLGYADVLAVDLRVARQQVERTIAAAVVAAITGLFTVALACFWIIAAFWDTDGRLVAIGALVALFGLVTVGSLMYIRNLRRTSRPFLNETLTEMAKDREAIWNGDHTGR